MKYSVKIKKLSNDDKKYVAIFTQIDKDGKPLDGGKVKKQKYGASGMSDYTKHKDIERRNRYIQRHKKDLRTNDPTRAGYLSMYILWNKPTLKASIDDYKKRLQVYNKTGRFPRKI